VLRRATPDDEDGIVKLSLDAHGEQEAWGLRFVIDRYGIDAWTVVVDGDEVVSTCMLMDHELTIGPADGVSVTVPTGQIEYVATAPDHQRRGLIRQQFDVHHATADQRGDLVVFIAGIPYFYRHLGYSYGVSYPRVHRVAPDALKSHDGWAVRRAEVDDLPVMRSLHERAQAAADLRIARTEHEWQEWIAERDTPRTGLYVAVHEGATRGWMSYASYPRDDMGLVVQAATAELAAAEVLLRHAVELAAGTPLYVLGRDGDPFGALLRSIAFPEVDDFNAIYTRVADPVALLESLRPVLDARLSGSVLANERGELLISLYSRSIRVTYGDGVIDEIAWAPGVEEPDGVSSIGVPPDAFPALALGRFGASGLAARVDDVTLGRQRALADVLFPRLVADVVGVL
jgi:hypothetical protein